MLEHRLGHGQPPEPVLDLRYPGTAPQRRIAPPHPLGHVLRHGHANAFGDRRLKQHRKPGVDPARLARDDRRAPLLDPGQQPAHRLFELFDAVDEQLVGDLFKRDTRVRERREISRRIFLSGQPGHRAVVGDGQKRRQRHRVDRVRSDQAVHVHGVGVVRVLGARRGPQRPLRHPARADQRIPSVTREQLLEPQVRRSRVGQRRLPCQIGSTQLLQTTVDVRVHPRDEERRHRVHVQFQALGVPALQSAQVRLRHLLVGSDREQQCDIDVDPLVQRLLDGGHALRRPRDLDHHIRPVDPAPERAHLLERALGVVRELRRDLERHESVASARVPVYTGEHVGGELHVADRDVLVDRHRIQVLPGKLPQIVVVVIRPEDRLLEDRGVRGDAAQRLHGDHPRQLAPFHHRTANLVEPDADARLGYR